MSAPVEFRYRAFISYSHADTDWAKWLHRGLESFRIDKELVGRSTATGTIPPALRPIFRDRDDFTAGHTLNEQTLAALDASAALIVLCSPASAKSHYVNEEIRLFKSRHATRPVIPLIVDGKPDDAELECFPSALKFKIDAKGRVTKKSVEVLAADARNDGDGKDLALAKVIAGLLGLSSDDVFRRAERERRAATRRRRRVQALVGLLALLLALGGLGWLKQAYLREQSHWRWTMLPDVLTAAAERKLKPGVEFTECKNGCPSMVVLPAGSFMMGSKEEASPANERPQHGVTIAKPFAAGKYEVTVGEWQTCVEAGACPPYDWSGLSDMPMAKVTWDEAVQYVAWLSRVTGKPYRLLSEAEWEYAVRAGTTTLYSFGDDEAELRGYAWYKDNAKGRSHFAGLLKPNGFGLHDMHGNVAEYVQDCFHNSYDGAPGDGTPWMSGATPASRCGKYRVFRGGAWNDGAGNVRSASRSLFTHDQGANEIGFRVARDLAQ
jgi:formylglycine-generating enzyme required for sulfatase activity